MANTVDAKLNDEAKRGAFKVRTITTFVVLSTAREEWPAVLRRHCTLLSQLSEQLAGVYTVQSVRVVTNPITDWAAPGFLQLTAGEQEAAALAALAQLRELVLAACPPTIRVRIAIGELPAELLHLVVPLISRYADIANCCVNVPCDELGLPDAAVTARAARVVQALGSGTPRGEGNFNFTVNFNCPPLIPYFPACYHRSDGAGERFALGFEYPQLVADVIASVPPPDQHASRNAYLAAVFGLLTASVQAHVDRVLAITERYVSACDDASRVPFAGIDSSPAPSGSTASVASLFELLGAPVFGASASVEIASFLTRVFKSVRGAPLVGFSGLMLACLEDVGLAAAAAGAYDIRALATYSAVCGIGLDTVPISAAVSADAIAALMRDVGTLAFRLQKPLTVRLFPVDGRPGELTHFESSDLVNCPLFHVP